MQLMLDLSTTVKPSWFILPNTQVGIRGTWRSLDQNSPRYPQPSSSICNIAHFPVGFGNGNEWEIRTYIHINVGK
jgi:hypothetical protein